MREGTVEFIKYRNISKDYIEKNFSPIITDCMFDSCYHWVKVQDPYSDCSYGCRGNFQKCSYINDKEQYNKHCWNTPRLFMNNSYGFNEDCVVKYGETSSPLDSDDPMHFIEDIIIRRNCNALIVKQKTYRSKSKKMGFVVRAVLAPSIDCSDRTYDDIVELIDLYDPNRERMIGVWSPTFDDDLFPILLKDKDIFLQMLLELSNNIEQDAEILVEKYLEDKKGKAKYEDWTIESFGDGNGEYYFEIDCRVLFSVIKQIMLCEDELYPEEWHRGRFKIIDDFIKKINKNCINT